MDCCGLSSTGWNNVDVNEITSDNITVFLNLKIHGINILDSIHNLNRTFKSESLSINITTPDNIIFMLIILNWLQKIYQVWIFFIVQSKPSPIIMLACIM